ncbi:unnamed protein product [Caenorhabditis brenneri]
MKNIKWKLLVSLTIVLIVSNKITVSDFTSDLEKVISVYNCDPSCTFNHSEITSKTKEFFPTHCYYVCGILTINKNTGLSETQIRKLFENMTTLFGGIKIENTLFQGFSVFAKHPTSNGFEFMCKTFGLSVINNTQLNNIDFLNEFHLGKDKKTDECPILFQNNPKLDVSSLCDDEEYKEMFQLKIVGNLKNCGCRGDSIISSTMESLQNCDLLNGGLNISNVIETNSSALSSVNYVKGDVEIHNTDFKNLSFLTKLETLEVKHGLMSERVAMNIHDNLEMTRFGISSLQKLYDLFQGPFIINLENLHPDFCLTVFEIVFFLENYIAFKNIHAQICPGMEKTLIDGYPICQFKSMKSLKEDCLFIHGNVIVGSGDEEFIYKLKRLQHLFGTLTIKNTKLNDLKSLSSLNYIASLEEEYVIEIISNENLVNADIPNLRVILPG